MSKFSKNSIFAKYKFNTDQKLNYMTIKNLYPAVILILISALLLFTRLNNRCSPIDADMPISIPFAGNSYVSEPIGSDFIDNYTGKFKRAWTDENNDMNNLITGCKSLFWHHLTTANLLIFNNISNFKR